MSKPKVPFEPEDIEFPEPYVDGFLLVVPMVEDDDAFADFYREALAEQMRRKK